MAHLTLQTSFFVHDREGVEFLDVPELNAHVSTTLAERLQSVKARADRGASPAMAVVVLGAAGAGKTHVLARLRHDGATDFAIVLLRPFFGVRMTVRDVLMSVVDQLCAPPRRDALAPIDYILAYWLRPNREADGVEARSPFPRATLDEWIAETPAAAEARLVAAVERVLERVPAASSGARILETLFRLPRLKSAARWRALAWISGREPRTSPTTQASDAELGEREEPLSETDVLLALRLIVSAAAPALPLLIAFDQLENLATDDDAHVLAYGNLIAELVDVVADLTIAQFALTSEWLQFIAPRLSLPQQTRVGGEVLRLEAPSEEVREQLLRAWYARIAPRGERGGKRKFPSPARAEDIRYLLDAPGMTPRMLLLGLRRALRGEPVVEAPSEAARSLSAEAELAGLFADAVKRVQDAREQARAQTPEASLDRVQLAEGLVALCHLLPKLSARVRLERDRLFIEVAGGGDTLTLVLAHAWHSRSVSSLLSRATEFAGAGKTMVLRPAALPLPETWTQAHERRREFEQLPNARWHWLEEEDVCRALAQAELESLARSKRLRGAEGQALFDVDALRAALRVQGPEHWPVLAAITRALTDIPRAGTTAEAREDARAAPRVDTRIDTASPPTDDAPDATPGQLTVREWLALGRGLARDALEPLFSRADRASRASRIQGSWLERLRGKREGKP